MKLLKAIYNCEELLINAETIKIIKFVKILNNDKVKVKIMFLNENKFNTFEMRLNELPQDLNLEAQLAMF